MTKPKATDGLGTRLMFYGAGLLVSAVLCGAGFALHHAIVLGSPDWDHERDRALEQARTDTPEQMRSRFWRGGGGRDRDRGAAREICPGENPKSAEISQGIPPFYAAA